MSTLDFYQFLLLDNVGHLFPLCFAFSGGLFQSCYRFEDFEHMAVIFRAEGGGPEESSIWIFEWLHIVRDIQRKDTSLTISSFFPAIWPGD